jgi:plastocyanin domain-containing protein
MTLLINIIGIALIVFTYWFFFMKKEGEAVIAGDEIKIIVEGGYKPDVIRVQKGNPTILNFHRKDESSCLEEVVIPEFNIRQHLALNETTPIEITPERAGEFQISCGMNMFHGKLIVED